MGINGPFTDEKFFGDLRIGLFLGDQLQDFLFPLGQVLRFDQIR